MKHAGAAGYSGSEPSSITLLTGSHLCHNPRAHKEARTLAAAGYDVEILGAWIDPELAAQDRAMLRGAEFRFTPVVDLTNGTLRAALIRQAGRSRRKVASWAHRAGSVDSRWQLGTVYPALRRAAFRRPAALAIAHSEPAIAVACDLHRIHCRTIGIDLEDWFSEDLLPEARRDRPLRLLRRFESILLREGAFASCPSRAMSHAVACKYGCSPPAVIYNAVAWAARRSLDGLAKDRADRRRPSIHWFSQTLGPGRGLEQLFAALPHIAYPVELHVRGRPAAGFAPWLRERVPEGWHHRIFFHDLVPHNELLSRIVEHDIGFAGELTYCRNRDLTITNKILHYLVGGLAIVASDTAGQREVAEQAAVAVRLYPPSDVVALAARLNELLGSPEHLHNAKVASIAAAQTTFCWERQEQTLINSVTASLRRSARVSRETTLVCK